MFERGDGGDRQPCLRAGSQTEIRLEAHALLDGDILTESGCGKQASGARVRMLVRRTCT
jgi:hypothetical protein